MTSLTISGNFTEGETITQSDSTPIGEGFRNGIVAFSYRFSLHNGLSELEEGEDADILSLDESLEDLTASDIADFIGETLGTDYHSADWELTFTSPE